LSNKSRKFFILFIIIGVSALVYEEQATIKKYLNPLFSPVMKLVSAHFPNLTGWKYQVHDQKLYKNILKTKDLNNSNDIEWRYSGFDQAQTRSVSLGKTNINNWKLPRLIWSANEIGLKSHKQVQSSAGFIDKKILTKTASGNFIAIGLDGKQRWKYKPSYGSFAHRGWASAQVHGRIRLFAPEGKFLKCINIDDGTNCEYFGNDGYVEICANSKVNPIISDDKIVVFGNNFCATSVGLLDGIIHYNKPLNPTKDKNFGGTIWANIAYFSVNDSAIIGTGNAKPAFDGRKRPGDNKHANSIVSIDLSSGNVNWAFQEISHDLWDLDIGAPPIVSKLHKQHKESIDVVVAGTKLGNTLVLDALTGELLNDFELIKSKKSILFGEYTPENRLKITSPKPFAEIHVKEDDLSFLATYDNAEYNIALNKLNNGISGYMVPHEPGKTSYYYGVHGGAEWPGGAYDMETGTYFIASNHIPWSIGFAKDEKIQLELNKELDGYETVNKKCLDCHNGSLNKIHNKVRPKLDASFEKTLLEGYGQMPAVSLNSNEVKEIIKYFENRNVFLKMNHSILQDDGFNKFVTSSDYPVTNPPWGTVNAISLKNKKFKKIWSVPIGNTKLGEKIGIKTGTEIFGGITLVDGRIIILSGTRDNKVFILDTKTGDILWEYIMPTYGAAAPIVFKSNGINYFFLQATGGGKLSISNKNMHQENVDTYMLFALP
jgi:quinoprotein glucose dehydrogenase